MGARVPVRSGVGSLLAALFAVLFAFTGLGCEKEEPVGPSPDAGSEDVTTVGAGEVTAPEVIVTSDDDRLPEDCRPDRVAQVVAGFVDAYNGGDGERLAQTFFIAEGPSPSGLSEEGYYPWSWYSVSEVGKGGKVEGGFITYDEAALMNYFARRHEQGERMRLLKLSLTQTGILGNDANVGFISVLTREADDLDPVLGGPDHVAFARGAVNCEAGWIFAWSMEMRSTETRDARDAAAWLCTDPPGWRPGDAVVACA